MYPGEVTTGARVLVSEAEFLTLAESTQRIELLDGGVILAPSPTLWHQEVLTRLVIALRDWAGVQRPLPTVVQAPFDVRFGDARILQSDAVVYLQPLPGDVALPVRRIPDLCVEVLSSDRAYDRVTKRFVYAEAGVSEYWIVEPAGLIERRCGAGLSRVEEIDGELQTALLPGFTLTMSDLFR